MLKFRVLEFVRCMEHLKKCLDGGFFHSTNQSYFSDIFSSFAHFPGFRCCTAYFCLSRSLNQLYNNRKIATLVNFPPPAHNQSSLVTAALMSEFPPPSFHEIERVGERAKEQNRQKLWKFRKVLKCLKPDFSNLTPTLHET